MFAGGHGFACKVNNCSVFDLSKCVNLNCWTVNIWTCKLTIWLIVDSLNIYTFNTFKTYIFGGFLNIQTSWTCDGTRQVLWALIEPKLALCPPSRFITKCWNGNSLSNTRHFYDFQPEAVIRHYQGFQATVDAASFKKIFSNFFHPLNFFIKSCRAAILDGISTAVWQYVFHAAVCVSAIPSVCETPEWSRRGWDHDEEEVTHVVTLAWRFSWCQFIGVSPLFLLISH